MKSKSLKIGKLYELKVLKASGVFMNTHVPYSATLWDNNPGMRNSTKVGNYQFDSGPFLVLGKHSDYDYQILAPNEKIGWVYFGSYMVDSQFYFIELLERKEPNQ